MRGAPNIQKMSGPVPYIGTGGDAIWRITRTPRGFTLKEGRTWRPVYWVARNGRKQVYGRTLFEIGRKLREIPIIAR